MIIQKRFTAKSKDKELEVSETNNDFTPIEERTEKGDVIRELNRDDVEGQGLSSIDTKTRLSPLQISGILAVDVLTSSKFLPKECSLFTRSAKRLNNSAYGLGRQDIVKIMMGSAQDDQNQGKTFFQRLGIGGQKKE